MGVDKRREIGWFMDSAERKDARNIYLKECYMQLIRTKKQKYVGIGRASISHDNYCLSMLVAFVQDHFMIHIVNKIVVLHRCGKSTSKLDSHDDRITREQTIR